MSDGILYTKALAESIDEEERTLVAWASTGVRDRDNEVIDPAGWVLDEYLKNPVVQWAHDYRSPPIAKALWVKKTTQGGKKGLLFKARFQAVTQAGEEIWQLYRDGFLNAFSVGFRSLEGEEVDPEQNDGVRYIHRKVELLEVSAVPVPANPDALVAAVEAGQFKSAVVLKALGLEDAKTVVPYSPTTPAPEGRAWDAAAAVKRLRAWAGGEDISWAKYRKGFAWYDSKEPELFGSYKLPHHDIVGGELVVVWRGVAAAMAALLGARGGVDIPESDRRGVYNHLAKHYKQFDKPVPEYRSIEEAAMLEEKITELETRIDGLQEQVSNLEKVFEETKQAEPEAAPEPEAGDASQDIDPQKLVDAIASAVAEGIDGGIRQAKGRLD